MKLVSKASKFAILTGGRALNHFCTYPARLCVNNLIFTYSKSTSSKYIKSLNQSRCL
jgi:hypothetical protein